VLQIAITTGEPLLVIIDFPYGKLVKSMFNIYQENTIDGKYRAVASMYSWGV
jgi:hypothetical protein